MEKNRHQKNLIIILLIICIFCLSIAFAAYSQSLNITGTADIEASTNNWNIMFSQVKTLNTGGYATGSYNREGTGESIRFVCEFVGDNDDCELIATISNEGTINALYKDASLNVSKDGISAQSSDTTYDDGILAVELIEPTNWTKNSTVLNASDSADFSVTATLKNVSSLEQSTTYTIEVIFYFEQADNN